MKQCACKYIPKFPANWKWPPHHPAYRLISCLIKVVWLYICLPVNKESPDSQDLYSQADRSTTAHSLHVFEPSWDELATHSKDSYSMKHFLPSVPWWPGAHYLLEVAVVIADFLQEPVWHRWQETGQLATEGGGLNFTIQCLPQGKCYDLFFMSHSACLSNTFICMQLSSLQNLPWPRSYKWIISFRYH